MRKKVVPRNKAKYEHLASEYLVAGNSKLDQCGHASHDLYNRALYDLRQGFFKRNYVKGYCDLDQRFKKRYSPRKSMLYHSLFYVQSA
ncbi:hypothetical protein IMAU40093_01956 [Lactobacillus helveticus]|nr:hypothetical protein [Lactobacillus helveticus]NRO17427.1 hypothetical protein [Lactobacillus helveticus]